jgi:hypothetical protein
VAGIEEVNTLRRKISERYVTHLNRKLEATMRFAAASGAELLVLPEYSFPPESLLLCRALCDELRLAMLAGSHVVTVSSEAQRVYRELGLTLVDPPPSTEANGCVRQAVCVVLLPGKPTLTFAKRVRSKWEMTLVAGDSNYHIFEMNTQAGAIEVEILICIEALSERVPTKQRLSRPRLIVIPAFTTSSAPFYDFGRLSLLGGSCTLFANVAEFGGSTVQLDPRYSAAARAFISSLGDKGQPAAR